MSVDTPLAVHWAGGASFSGLAGPSGLAIVGIRGQPDRKMDREMARLRIRAALVAALAAHCGIDAGRIELHSPQGAAPWAVAALDAGPRRIALSISHDGDISVAACSFNGAVGIDVTSILPVPDWRPVARDYLGPAAADALASLPHGERDTAFAHAWSEHEACLKCLGLQLDEWCDDLALAFRTCRSFPLALPEGHVGYLAMAGGRVDVSRDVLN